MTELTATLDRRAPAPRPHDAFLRRVLLADAVTSGATGLLMTLGAGALGTLLGLPVALLQTAGLILLPFAVGVAYLATRPALPRSAVWSVIVLNALWALDSILLLLTGWVAPTVLGAAFVVIQAAVVAVLAELQVVGLRRSTATAVA